VDTVGHVNLDTGDTAALKSLYKVLNPTEVLLVADAMTGQEAVHAAEKFNETIPLSGLILTKLDGDARGGAALSIRAVTGIPIKFVGMGEKADALEAFYPDRFASRILGMGDMLTLIEKAKAEITEDEAESLTQRMKKGELTLDDFLGQFQRIKKMGPLGQLIGMVPGLSQIKKQLDVDNMDEDFFKHIEAIIYSMTKDERRNPDVIDGSRRRRIALGSGTQPADVNRVLKQFKEAKKIMQMISTGRGSKISPSLR
jgi:signal recognition particle subunit SRP54